MTLGYVYQINAKVTVGNGTISSLFWLFQAALGRMKCIHYLCLLQFAPEMHAVQAHQ